MLFRSSIDEVKALDKIQHLIMMKTCHKLDMDEIFLNMIKEIYFKKTPQLTYLMMKERMFFPSDRRQYKDVHPPHFYSTLYGGSGPEIRQEQGIKIRKEELKLPLLRDDMILLLKQILRSPLQNDYNE